MAINGEFGPVMGALDVDGTLVQGGVMPAEMQSALVELSENGQVLTFPTARVDATFFPGLPEELLGAAIKAHLKVEGNKHGGMLTPLFDGTVVDVVRQDATGITIEHVHTFPMGVPAEIVLAEIEGTSSVMGLVDGVVWRKPDMAVTNIVDLKGDGLFSNLNGKTGIRLVEGDIELARAALKVEDKISGEYGKAGELVEEGGQLGGLILITKADCVKQLVESTSIGLDNLGLHSLVSSFGKEHAMVHIMPKTSGKMPAVEWISAQYGGIPITLAAGDSLFAGYGLDKHGNDASILTDRSISERYFVVSNQGAFADAMTRLAGRLVQPGFIPSSFPVDMGADYAAFLAQMLERSSHELMPAIGVAGLAQILTEKARARIIG